MPYYYSNDNRGGGFLSNVPTVTRNLVIINCIVFLATLINKGFMMETFALFYPTSPFFHWWQVVTHMFMHGGFWHIFFNMYTLIMFGMVVENYIGSKKFLMFYFICGLGAAGLHLGVEFLQMQSFMDSAALGHPVDSYRGRIRCHIWTADSVCDDFPTVQNDSALPSCYLERQVDGGGFCGHRTPYRCYRYCGGRGAFCSSWRNAYRLYHDMGVEKKGNIV